MIRALLAPTALALLMSAPAAGKDSLGVFDSWAAFRDVEAPRCYAIAKPRSRQTGFATIAQWPSEGIKGQFHIRLSRTPATGARVRLAIGTSRFNLSARGADAWAKDPSDDAAIIAALRSASRMSASAQSARGGRFTDRYELSGVATAIDAAVVGCASL